MRLDPINLFDYEARAKQVLPHHTWEFIAGGSKDEITTQRNRTAFDAVSLRPRMLRELRAAAQDALDDNETEVAVLITRRWVSLKGGLSLVATDELVFFARVLARSRRPEDADSILAIARARDTSSDANEKLEALRREFGIVQEDGKSE